MKNALSQKNYGHYYADAVYKLNSDFQLRSKQEYKARKWSYYALVPYQKLKLAIKNRY